MVRVLGLLEIGRPWRARTRVLGLGLAVLTGCTGSSSALMNSTTDDPPEVPPWSCVPGETQACPCPDELEGLMTCDAQGAGFGECDCSPGAVSQGPAPTSTGSGSDTGSGTAGTGDTTVDPTSSSSGAPDPSTTSSSSGGPDPSTTSSSSGTGSSG